MSWRDRSAPLVERAIRSAQEEGLSGRELVRRCNEEFPWGERKYHPYGTWKSEVKRQLGLIEIGRRPRPIDAPGQGMMF